MSTKGGEIISSVANQSNYGCEVFRTYLAPPEMDWPVARRQTMRAFVQRRVPVRSLPRTHFQLLITYPPILCLLPSPTLQTLTSSQRHQRHRCPPNLPMSPSFAHPSPAASPARRASIYPTRLAILNPISFSRLSPLQVFPLTSPPHRSQHRSSY
jgi:hypothetical protein